MLFGVVGRTWTYKDLD